MNWFTSKTPEAARHETLLSAAILSGGAALLVGIAAMLSGSAPLSSERTSVALQSALRGQAAAVATYNSSGSWTAPAGISNVLVTVVGGGGGGAGGAWSEGNCAGDAGLGGAGGAGGYILNQVVSVTPGQTYSVVVGGGGAGGARACGSNYKNGSPGGNSSFGSVTATGGGAGVWYAGGAGGTPQVSACTGGGPNSGFLGSGYGKSVCPYNGTAGNWYCSYGTVAGTNGSGYGGGGLSYCAGWGQAGQAGAVFISDPLSLAATPQSVAYNGTSVLSYAATTVSPGGYDACYLSGGQWGSNPGTPVGTSGSANTSALTSSTQYSYTCHDTSFGWLGPATATVSVAIPSATVALTATPMSVYTGQSSTLSWSGTNLASCNLAGGNWGGGTVVAISNSGVSTGALSQSTTYTLTCTGLNGGTVGDMKVIAAVPPPTVSISANPSIVGTGARTTATWSSTNVQSGTCTEYVVAPTAVAFASSQSGSQQTPPLTQSGWLEIDCQDLTGAWAIATAPFTVSGSNQPPTVSISASPVYVRLGDSSTISWSAQNASTCSIVGPSFSASGHNGSKTTGALATAGDYTYTITCQSPFGFPDATGSTVVHAVDLPAPSFSASPTSVLPGGLSTLSWTCPNPPYTSSTGDTHYTTGGAVSGSAGVNPLQTTTYSVTCNAAGGLSLSGSAQVSVLSPTLTITATPNKVKKGKTTIIAWSASNITAGSCHVTGTDGSSWSGASGSQSPTINAPTTFTLACSVPSGALSQSVTVSLIPNIQEI